jgi:predicted metal-dependent peptidase
MEWIETLFQEPKISWIDYLKMKESGHARVMRTASRKRPTRRGGIPEYEGRIRRGGLEVWCVIDVSGSRTANVISTAHPEMRAMVERGATIWLIQVDASVQAVEKFGGEKYEMECFGRGGTDMEEAFRKKEEIMKKTGAEPDFWVIFTDGITGRLTIPVDEEVLIVLDDTGMKPEEFRKSVCDHPDVVVLDTAPPGLDQLYENH